MGFSKKLRYWRRKRNVAVTTHDIATQTPDVNEEPEKITDDGGEKVKKIAEQQKLLQSNQKQIAALQKLLESNEKQIAALQKLLESNEKQIAAQQKLLVSNKKQIAAL